LNKRLNDLGYHGKLDTFEGAHEIPMSVVNNVSGFLDRLIVSK
jgi:predicted esterase